MMLAKLMLIVPVLREGKQVAGGRRDGVCCVRVIATTISSSTNKYLLEPHQKIV